MRIDPAIVALRRDRAPQRRAQAATIAACDTWRRSSEAHEILADFERYADGASLTSCPSLLAVFAEGGLTPSLTAALVSALCPVLAAEPFAHPPFRHGYDRGTATLLLARRGLAQLVLHASEPGARAFDTAAFSHAERHEAVLAGEARARMVRRQGQFGRLAQQALVLRPGVLLVLDLREQALQLLRIERRLVSFRLHRSASSPEPSREYDLATGALLHQAAGDIRASRHEAMLALLGRMRWRDAAPVMAAIAREPGDASLRWQALRECLALDTAAGFAALSQLARAGDDPLAVPAAALRTQLIETHAELRVGEPATCHA